MHEREGPRKINTCPRIDEELWTFQVPTILALKMDLLIFFLTNFIFENRLKTYAKVGKIRTDVKIQRRILPPWEFYGGRVPYWHLKRSLWSVMYWKYIIFCPSNIHLLFGNRGPPSFIRERFDRFFFFFFDLHYLKNNRLKSSNVWYTHYECFTYFVIWLFNSLVCRVITHSIMKGLNQKA